jgi:serine/threonine protein kinase
MAVNPVAINTLDQPVAMKVLPAGVAGDADRLAQFNAELRIARRVSHKNVCRLYDLGDADGRRFLTMEYVACCTAISSRPM